MDKISIVVPVYNVEPYFKECIDSILRQTLKEFVLILVDDGSTDNSGTICDEYKQIDNRIVVIHKSNGGLSDARNVGIDYAFSINAKWITFIDSDDYIHERYLEYLYRAVIENDCEISICNYTREEEIIDSLDDNYNSSIINVKDFYINKNVNAVIAWGKLYLLDLFDNIRYPVGRIHEDEFTTHKLLFNANKVSYIDLPLYYYRLVENSIINQKFNIKRYDALDAILGQVDFFNADIDLYEYSKNKYLGELSSYSLLSRKNKIYNQVPKKYRISKWKAILNLYRTDKEDNVDYFLYQIYPHLVSLKCYAHKLIDMILRKKKGSN